MIDALVLVLPAFTVRLPLTTGDTNATLSSSFRARMSSILRMTVPFAPALL